MSEDIEKAARDAVDAAANSEQLQLIAAVLQAQQLAQQQPAAPAPVVQRPYGAYIGVGIVGIAAVTALGFVAAVLAVALSIGAVSLTICTVILRSVWADYQRDRDQG